MGVGNRGGILLIHHLLFAMVVLVHAILLITTPTAAQMGLSSFVELLLSHTQLKKLSTSYWTASLIIE
jgi:hypothetical protein